MLDKPEGFVLGLNVSGVNQGRLPIPNMCMYGIGTLVYGRGSYYERGMGTLVLMNIVYTMYLKLFPEIA